MIVLVLLTVHEAACESHGKPNVRKEQAGPVTKLTENRNKIMGLSADIHALSRRGTWPDASGLIASVN
jgi:hypothetical protein